jgi:hypothetical protein
MLSRESSKLGIEGVEYDRGVEGKNLCVKFYL